METLKNDSLVQMKVTGLTIDPFTNMPIIILKDLQEKMALPIWIGLIEASAVATELEKIELSRPMTHDLMKNMLHELGIVVKRVAVIDLTDNTFYAEIVLVRDDETLVMDSRPSDAIALALRVHAPIYVAKKVMDKSRRIDLTNEADAKAMREQKWAEILDNLSPEDFGKYKM